MLSVTLPSIDLSRIGHGPSRHGQPVCTFSILPACADVPSEDIPFAIANNSNTPMFRFCGNHIVLFGVREPDNYLVNPFA